MVGGLENGAAASGQHGGQLPRGHEEGEVPRHNLAHHADGFAKHQRHGVFVQHYGSALVGAHNARKITEVVGGKRNIHIQGFPNGLAVVQSFDHCQVLFVGVDKVGNFQQQIGAFDGVYFFPAVPGLGSGRYGIVHILLGGFGAGGKAFAVSGAKCLECAAVGGRFPLAVNE